MKTIKLSHGGLSGDIVYGLALARHVALANACLIDLYIPNDRPYQHPPGMNHPNGHQYLMSQGAFDFIRPLLVMQPFVNEVFFVPDAHIPADAIRLDPYRSAQGLNVTAGNIADYPGKIYGIAVDLSEPWLSTRPMKPSPSTVTVGISNRYRNTAIDYSFLAKIERVRYVGLPEEYEDFKRRHGLPGLTYEKCASAVELAETIRSSRVFIGNQSMPFAIAEALKVNRILETCELCPNVIPSGRGGGSFIYQAGLFSLLRYWGIQVPQGEVRNLQPTYALDLSAAAA
jgi:hypothetical protein